MSCYNWSGTVPGGGSTYFAISVAVAGPVTFKWSLKAALGTLSNTGFAWEVVKAGTGVLVVGGANAGASGSFTYTLPAGQYDVWLYDTIVGGAIAISGSFTTTGACSSVLACPATCPAHTYCSASTGYKCVACSPACASGCTCGPHANTCTCPPPKCPTCATCTVCTNPAVGCVPVSCPSGTHCANNVCVANTPPPPPPGSGSELVPVLAIGGGVAGLLWLANRHSQRSGQARRGDHRRVTRRR